jgi:hypothetical protein
MTDTTVITRATDATTVTMADAITVYSTTEATTVVGTGNAGPSGVGVPTGGTDGQVLTKTSATDYATAWEDATGGGAALTYPTFIWEQYEAVDHFSVAASGNLTLPLDTSNGGVVINPAGWTIAASTLEVPDGIYAITWYWEADAAGLFFDNYISASRVTSTTTGFIYPTAPMGHPDSSWGSASVVLKLVGNSVPDDNTIQFGVNNKDTVDPHGIVNLITVTRLDA